MAGLTSRGETTAGGPVPPNPAQTGQPLVSPEHLQVPLSQAPAPTFPGNPREAPGNRGGRQVMNMDGGTDPAPRSRPGQPGQGSPRPLEIQRFHWNTQICIPGDSGQAEPPGRSGTIPSVRRIWGSNFQHLPRAQSIPNPRSPLQHRSQAANQGFGIRKTPLPPGGASGRSWRITRHDPGPVLESPPCEDASPDPADVRGCLTSAVLQQGLSPGMLFPFIPAPKPAAAGSSSEPQRALGKNSGFWESCDVPDLTSRSYRPSRSSWPHRTGSFS